MTSGREMQMKRRSVEEKNDKNVEDAVGNSKVMDDDVVIVNLRIPLT